MSQTEIDNLNYFILVVNSHVPGSASFTIAVHQYGTMYREGVIIQFAVFYRSFR